MGSSIICCAPCKKKSAIRRSIHRLTLASFSLSLFLSPPIVSRGPVSLGMCSGKSAGLHRLETIYTFCMWWIFLKSKPNGKCTKNQPKRLKQNLKEKKWIKRPTVVWKCVLTLTKIHYIRWILPIDRPIFVYTFGFLNVCTRARSKKIIIIATNGSV